MIKQLLFLSFLVFISCTSQPEQVENTSLPIAPQPIDQNQIEAIPNFTTQIFLVDSLNPKSGFGYNILVDGSIFIHQATIPSLPGNKAFDSKEKAELVANLVSHKLKNNIMPPSVTKAELDSLKILIP
jgi:hypothetical protein